MPTGGPALADRFFPPVEGAPVAVPDNDGVQQFGGTIDEPSEVYLAEAHPITGSYRSTARRWTVRKPSVGPTSSMPTATGSATLRFNTPFVRYLLLGLQTLLWIAAIVYLLRVRVVRDERQSLEEIDLATTDGGS